MLFAYNNNNKKSSRVAIRAANEQESGEIKSPSSTGCSRQDAAPSLEAFSLDKFLLIAQRSQPTTFVLRWIQLASRETSGPTVASSPGQ